MKINPVTLVIIIVFLYPIIKGFFTKFSSTHIKQRISSVTSDISFIASIFLGFIVVRKLFLGEPEGIYSKIYSYIPKEILTLIESKPIILYVVIAPLLIFIFYVLVNFILHVLNIITIYIAVDSIEMAIKRKSNLFKRVIGAIFDIPTGICYVLLLSFILNFITIFNFNNDFNKYVESSKLYNYICKGAIIPITDSKLAKQLPNIIDNSFKIVVKEDSSPSSTELPQNTIIYYNGVTLEEGVKTNDEINKASLKLTANTNNERDKAEILYQWIGKNIEYDYEKAERILNNDYRMKSGAIEAFETKKGICFDYACLYVAMCRANNLPVRLVTGKGFNGVTWVSHAWNQVYIKEENKWVNVDPTFYKGGNYFDSLKFDLDHKEENIAKEWS